MSLADSDYIYDYLRANIVGQDMVMKRVAKAVVRSQLGIASPGRPLASFLFLGPTGVGKTETAVQLSELIYKEKAEEALLRLDMAEFQDVDAVEDFRRMITTHVDKRGKIGGILLLDEIEKGYREILMNLLQILDAARLTYQDVTRDLSNYIVICTSNLGCKNAINMENSSYATMERNVKRAAEAHLNPENVARFNDACVFQLLQYDAQSAIAEAILTKYLTHVHKRTGLFIEYDDDVFRFIIRQGFDMRLGARPLRNKVEEVMGEAVAIYLQNKQVSAEGEKVSCRVSPNSKGLYLI